MSRFSGAQDEAALGQIGQGIFESPEVAAGEGVDRPAARAPGPDPAPQHGWAGTLAGLGEQLEEDRQLGAVLELAREQRERVDVERLAELVLGEPEQIHQLRRALALRRCVARAQNSWFSPPNTWLTDPSVKIWRIELVRRSAQGSTLMLSGVLHTSH